MKPLLVESYDNHALEALGKASVQIVHDVKNQINGLKLYATFLRKRMEKSERPEDELQTVNKLIAGLDRTAVDLSLIVQFGHPLELRKQPGVVLQNVMNAVATSVNQGPRASGSLSGLLVVEAEPEPLIGEFDTNALTEALRSISTSAMKMAHNTGDRSLIVQVEKESNEPAQMGVIEWRGIDARGHDPFNSFVGSDGLRMALAVRVIEAHGGSAQSDNGTLRVQLPLAS